MRLENLVYNILSLRDSEVSYLREKYEVDFFIQNILYQVAYDLEDEKTRKRELGAFRYFRNERTKKCRVITFDTNEVVDGIEVLSFDRLFFEI